MEVYEILHICTEIGSLFIFHILLSYELIVKSRVKKYYQDQAQAKVLQPHPQKPSPQDSQLISYGLTLVRVKGQIHGVPRVVNGSPMKKESLQLWEERILLVRPKLEN